MSIDIFIKSYPKDFPYLYYCLESINKFVTGVDNVVIVLPMGANVDFNPHVLPKKVHIIFEEEIGNGYIFQQYCKLNAHNYCFSNYIMFVDSDCIFKRPINLQTLIRENGCTEILKTKYEHVGDAICWKEPTEKFFDGKIPVEYEYMRRNCMMYRRETLVNLYSLKKDMKSYVLKQDRFSEFNVVGVFIENYEPQNYILTDTANWEYKDHFIEQLWSWGSFEDQLPIIQDILK